MKDCRLLPPSLSFPSSSWCPAVCSHPGTGVRGCSPTYAVAAGALQLQVAVELGGQSTLPLHLPAQVEGPAPGAVLPAVDHVAPTALGMREGDNED